MPRDSRNTLEVLKAELNFVQKGGYGRSPREPWRATLVFEDSPTCMNYDAQEKRAPCTECVLAQFVPADKLGEEVPCRHISVTPQGETIMDLYHGWTDAEIEETMAKWLKKTIESLGGEAATNAPSEPGR